MRVVRKRNVKSTSIKDTFSPLFLPLQRRNIDDRGSVGDDIHVKKGGGGVEEITYNTENRGNDMGDDLFVKREEMGK